ncbi:MAG TPA: aldo/keto reductase [Nitrosopumilaceae archaeon]|nr:aldo/keto reductase [Nitrosopumilaceae archaeon]
MIKGSATPSGTLEFLKNHPTVHPKNFQIINGLSLSNLGIGTYLGNPDSHTDELVINAVKKSILAGINVVDTAINYRSQKAERCVGKAISELIKDGKVNRDEIFISTKNGYVTNDGDIKEEFWQYVNREYVERGIIQKNDISSGYHCMTIPYLKDQLERSRNNLGLECIDLIYLHNAVEGQIQDISKEQFMKNLRDVIEFYESQRKENKIKFYGLATWECFRVQPENPQFLELADVINLTKEVGGKDHGFRFIQLPFNMYLDQALILKNQKYDGNQGTILQAAKNYGVGVFTSVPLMQAKLLSPGVMPEFNDLKPSLRALQFVRSTPGVLAPLVGQKLEQHVNENLEILKIPPIPEVEFHDLVNKLTSSQTR